MVRFYYIVGNFLKNKKLLTKLVETMAIAVGLFSTAFAFVFDYKCCRLYLHNFLSVVNVINLVVRYIGFSLYRAFVKPGFAFIEVKRTRKKYCTRSKFNRKQFSSHTNHSVSSFEELYLCRYARLNAGPRYS